MDCANNTKFSKQDRKEEKERVSRLNRAAKKHNNKLPIRVEDVSHIPLVKRLTDISIKYGWKDLENNERYWRDKAVSLPDSKEREELIFHLAEDYEQLRSSKLFSSFCKMFNSMAQRQAFMEFDFTAQRDKDRKRHNRIGATLRIKTALPEGVKSQAELSPWLDISRYNIPFADRLREYSRKHKCPHGRSWNHWTVVGRSLVPLCDHEYECYRGLTTARCANCGNSKIYDIDRICGCEVHQCNRCQFSVYKDQNGNGQWSLIKCFCDMDAIKAKRIEEEGILFNDRGQYIYKSSTELMEIFLKKQVRSRISKITDVTFANQVKGDKRMKITDVLSEPNILSVEDFPELPTVVPHGAMASTAKSAAGTAKNMVVDISNKIVEMGNSILEWVKKQVTDDFYQRHPLFTSALSAFGCLFRSVGTFLKNKSIFDYAMIFNALMAGSKTTCATIAIILVEIGSIAYQDMYETEIPKFLLEPVGTILKQWSEAGEVRKTEAIKDVAKSLFPVLRAFDISNPQADSSMFDFLLRKPLNCDQYGAVKRAYESFKAYDERQKSIFSQTLIQFDARAEDVEQHGVTDFINLLVSALPFQYHKGMFKAASMFCKELLPLILVSRCVVQFSTKIWTWFTKFMGWMTTDTKTWLQLEMKDEDSPIFQAVTVCFDYKMAAMSDASNAGAILSDARAKVNAVEEFIREEKRYDSCTIGLLKDLERLLSVPLPPVARKHEPFCVRFWGKPGTGKSRAVPTIVGPVMGCKTQEEFYQKTFCRNMQEYWDGVGVRQCILYDDFGQNRAEPTDLLELILLVSAAPFMANMANINGTTPKGISLDPKIVIVNSNRETDYTASVTEPEAISRRFHVIVVVEREGDETLFSVEGGSMVDGGRPLLPKATRMTLEQMQKFFHCSYQIFMNDRAEGLAKIEAIGDKNLPSLLKFDKCGRAQNDLEKYDKDAINNFFGTLKTPKVHVAPPKFRPKEKEEEFLSSNEDEEPTVVQHAGISWAQLANCYLLESSSNFLVFLTGLNLVGSFAFLNDFLSNGVSWRGMRTLLIPPITAAASILILFLVYKYNQKEVEVEPHSSEGKGKEAARRVTPHGDKAVTDIQQILERAICKIMSPDGMTLHGLLIAETYLLTVEHIFVPSSGSDMYVPDGSEYQLVVPGMAEPAKFRFDRTRLRPIKQYVDGEENETDVVVYQLPKCIPMQRNIIKKFWEGTRPLRGSRGLLLKYARGTRQQVWVETILEGEQRVKYDQGGKRWVQMLGYASHYGEPGMCGCPIMLSTGDTNAPVVGIHIAGNPGKNGASMFIILTKEMILQGCPTLNNLEPPSMDTPYSKEIIPAQPHAELLQDTTLQQVGVLTRPIYNPTKTSLRPSLVFDQIVPHTTEPSVLSNYDPRIPKDLRGVVDLYKDGVNKMKHPMDLHSEELISVKKDMIEWYSGKATVLSRTHQSPYTIFKCLNTGTLKGIDMSTSPGYPFVFRGMKRDKLFLREEDTFLRADEPFLTQLLSDLLKIKEGTLPDWFFITALKDERRPIEKVRVKPKTRLFTVCPIVYIILEKMFYAPFMEVLMLSDDVPYAGGVDRLGRSWHTMFARLRKTSDRGFGGDYECFDGRLSYGLMETAHDIMESVLSKDDMHKFFSLHPNDIVHTLPNIQLVKEINALNVPYSVLLKAIRQTGMNPTYLMKDFAFRASGTLASGRWVTQLVGTLSGEILQRAAWNDLAPSHVRGGANFKRFVAHSIMSDDNINAVVESALKFFNAETFGLWLKKRGMVYTSADKKGTALPWEPLEEISFLKNKTGLLKSFYCPIMEYSAAIEQINWVRKSEFNTPFETLEMNANAALRALFFHGKPHFEQLRNDLLRKQPTLNLDTYNVLLGQYLDTGSFPGYHPGEPSYWDQMGEVPKLGPNWKEKEFEEPAMEILTAVDPSKEKEERQTGIETKMSIEFETVIQHGKFVSAGIPISNYCPMCSAYYDDMKMLFDHMYVAHRGEPNLRYYLVGKFGNECFTCLKPEWRSSPMASFMLHNCENCTVPVMPHGDSDVAPIVDDPAILEVGPIVTDPVVASSLKEPTEEVRTSDNSQGTILADKGPRDTVMVKTASLLKFSAPRAESHLNDQAWDLSKMLSKYNLVANIPWQVGTPADTLLWDGDVVKDLVRTAFAQSPFSVFKDFRCAGVRIKAIMIASKFHQGRIVVGFAPTMVPKAIGAYPRYPPNTKTMIETGAVILDPSQGGETELYIPFRHPKGYLALEEDDALGQLCVTVLSPLQTGGSGSQEVIIKLFFSLDQPEFKLPRASSVTAAQLREFERLAAAREEKPRQMSPLVPFVTPHGDKPIVQRDAAQTSINEWKREGQYVAATRAFTKDPKTSHFGEKEDNLLNYMKRYRLAASYDVVTSSTDVYYGAIEMEEILSSFWVLDWFNLMRGAINIKIVPQIFTNVDVEWTAVYEPMPMEFTNTKYYNAMSSRQFNGPRSVTAHNTQKMEFQIPFLCRSQTALVPWHYKKGFQSTSPYFPSGTIFIRARGFFANNIKIKLDVFASLSDEFGVGVFRGVPRTFYDETLPYANQSPDLIQKVVDKVTPHGLIETLISAGAGEAKKLVDKIVPSQLLSTAMAMMDKPALAHAPEAMIIRNLGNFNYATGPEHIDKFALNPARQQLVDPEHFGSKGNEALMSSLFQRPSALARAKWDVGQKPGDLLFQIPVTPTLDHFLNNPKTNGFSPSIMCALAQKFKFWRGGITFVFDIVCTNFHEGKLDITFHPNVTTVPADYDTRMGQYVVSTTIRNSENRFEITVPYLAEEPWRNVFVDQPLDNPSATSAPPSVSQFTSGMLAVSVGASLRVPETVPPEVEILIYVMPAADFELLEPSMDCLALKQLYDV